MTFNLTVKIEIQLSNKNCFQSIPLYLSSKYIHSNKCDGHFILKVMIFDTDKRSGRVRHETILINCY